MKYKQSIFNMELDRLKDGKTLYFNTGKASFVTLNNEYIEYLKAVEEKDIAIENDEIAQNLFNQGFIVPYNLNEIEYLKLKSNMNKYSQDGYSYTIALTLDCNMACPYCYEKKNGMYMSREIQDKIIEHVEDNIEKGIKFISITWYGGEPLLAMDTISYMSEKIIELCDKNKVNYSASIVTNGLLLTKDIALKLVDYKVSFAQVTIDGLEETHNSRRIAVDSLNSFQTIIKNLQDSSEVLPISVRINTDLENQKEIPELIDYLKSIGLNNKISPYVAPVEDKTNSGYDGCLSFMDFADFQTNLLDELFTDDTISRFYPTPCNIACGAQCINSAVIDPSGDIFKCWEEVGVAESRIGNLLSNETNIPNLMRFTNIELPGECYECVFLPLCQGGCPYTRLFNNNQAACCRNVASVKTVLLKYYGLWKNKEDLKNNA